MLPSPQVCLSTLVTVSTMAVLDLYLLEQSMLGRGSRAWPAAWACTAVALGDLGFLLALRFVSAGVASEARSPRRAFASALWFLFLSLLELKLFFVCQNYRHERRPADPLARKTLTLLLSVGLPSLFLVLTGAEHVTPAHRKQEVRARLLWVALDLLDVLDLQAGLWEEAQSGAVVPLWVDGVVFFYCYVLLLLLPCVSLTELALPGLRRARREAVYPWLSLFAINVMTLGLRAVGVLWYRDPRISTVFVGKNVLALVVKLRSAWDVHRNGSGGGQGERGEGGGRNQSLGMDAEQVEQGQGGTTPSTQDHTLLRTHGQSHIRLDRTESSLGSAFISEEL
ncbi:transmembrane protein 121 [Pangasianodon hypophthalmus]|uniref:transmembrane protein 121 n=1 Tax=Pangasianodon hypophthalmus TaxID=310915 RepID=UPI000EFF685E|nr:transmembrane protein 121 [Pangasianodon hypophthalmus]